MPLSLFGFFYDSKKPRYGDNLQLCYIYIKQNMFKILKKMSKKKEVEVLVSCLILLVLHFLELC